MPAKDFTTMKTKFTVKIVDMRKKTGMFFGSKYYLTLYFTDDWVTGSRVVEVPVSAEQYYSMECGIKYLVTMYVHSDGIARFGPE